MIKQIRYTPDGGWLKNGRHPYRHSRWDVCLDRIFRIFEIPDAAKTVWLTAHKNPSVDRVKITSNDFIEVDGKPAYFLQKTLKSIVNLLKKHGTFYVSAEYQL